MHVSAVFNQKGGASKSTTAVSLAASWALQGRKCLVIDLDQQGHASSFLGVGKGAQSLYELLTAKSAEGLEEIAQPTNVEDVDVVASSGNLLQTADFELQTSADYQYTLKDALEVCEGRWDSVLIDCPPSVGVRPIMALTAAEVAVVPVVPERAHLDSVADLMGTIAQVRKRLNPNLAVRMLISQRDNTSKHKKGARRLREAFGEDVLATVIPRDTKVGEAPESALPVTHYAPHCRGSIAFQNAAEELMEMGL